MAPAIVPTVGNSLLSHVAPIITIPYPVACYASVSPVIQPRGSGERYQTAVASPPGFGRSEGDRFAQFRAQGLTFGLEGPALAQFVQDRIDRAEEKEEKERRHREEKEEKERKERKREEKERLEREERETRYREEKEERAEKERRDREEKEAKERRDREDREEDRRAEQQRWADLLTQRQNNNQGNGQQFAIKMHLEPLDDRDNIEAYLRQFERVVETQGLLKEQWAIRLAPLLKGAARDVYLRLTREEAEDYEILRKALLNRFQKTAEYYRQEFRKPTKGKEETFPMFASRLYDMVDRWFALDNKDMSDATEVIDVFVTEQLYSVMNPELQMFVRDRKPRSR